jgi:DtxR family Mn-dependent transcriptional regulator
LFHDEGVEPGLDGSLLESAPDHVTVGLGDRTATLTRSVAETVSVIADPSPPPRTALPDQLVLGRERYGR